MDLNNLTMLETVDSINYLIIKKKSLGTPAELSQKLQGIYLH